MKGAVLRYLQEVAMVTLLCSFVILANVVTGWTILLKHYSFYFAVFFFLFIPVWLVAFGMVFQPKWKWYSMLSGSFLAIFGLCSAFFLPREAVFFRIVNAFVLAIIGCLSVLAGWTMRKLVNSLLHDLTRKKGKRHSKQPTSLGT